MKAIVKMDKLFRYIQEELGENTQAQTVRYLLNVANNKNGVDHSDLAKLIGVSKASISRNCDMYGPSPSSGQAAVKKSLLLVDYHPDDRRRLISKLNSEGEKFIAGLVAILEEE